MEELRIKQLGNAQEIADTVDLGQLNLDGPIFQPTTPQVYYFHPDHLGSSTMISDGAGYAYQMFLNLPFGETMAEQRRSGTLNNPYKFNGKELDSETNLYYYGARYYDPRICVFISVDPLAEQTMTPYQYTYQNPVRYIDPDGMWPIYGKDGTYLGDDERHEEGKDLAFTGTAIYDDEGNISGYENLSQFTDNHTRFQTISSIIKHEGVTTDAIEYLWIAHTANNAANESGKSLYSKLMSGYSSVAKSKKTPLSISDNGNTAKAARAGVIHVMSGGNDPTGGATLWDGTDFLAWGLNSPNGTPHNKFEEYKSISISGSIYSNFLNTTLSKYSSGKVRYYGKYYNIPAPVFTDENNWSKGNFFYNTGEKRPFRIEATGTVGHSIFWKKIK